MLPRVREFKIAAAPWGQIPVMRPVHKDGDPWGDFACLKGTLWEKYIRVVSGDALSQALHGRMGPLLVEIGPDPRLTLKLMAKEGQEALRCRQVKECLMVRDTCTPGKKVPQCYEPPGLPPGQITQAAGIVARAWSAGQFFLVVIGGEYSYV